MKDLKDEKKIRPFKVRILSISKRKKINNFGLPCPDPRLIMMAIKNREQRNRKR